MTTNEKIVVATAEQNAPMLRSLLIDQPPVDDDWAASSAAMSGDLACLRLLIENKTPHTSEVCAISAQFGHYDCLVYALQSGCPCDVRAYRLATQYGHTECAKVLSALGYTSSPRGPTSPVSNRGRKRVPQTLDMTSFP